MTYGLNALSGRRPLGGGAWGGRWDSSNSRELVNYTVSKGYPVDSWELGQNFSLPLSISLSLYLAFSLSLLPPSHLFKRFIYPRFEPGNELSGGGIGARVDVEQYARDMVELKAMVEKIYQPPLRKPLLVAPGGFFDKGWYARFLQLTGPNVVDVVSHHIYNLGAGELYASIHLSIHPSIHLSIYMFSYLHM